MTTVDEMHAANLERFGAIETRLTVLEVQWRSFLTVTKWGMGAGLTLLGLIWGTLLMHP